MAVERIYETDTQLDPSSMTPRERRLSEQNVSKRFTTTCRALMWGMTPTCFVC